MATAEMAAATAAGELGQQTVELSALVRLAAEESYLSLKELVERSRATGGEQSDEQKKIELLKFVVKTRQRMLRLHVLAKWCQQVPLIQYCQQLAATLSSHDTCFTQTADSLFYMHEGLQQARAPIFDVPSAVEVLLTGSYKRLPKCIEDLGVQTALGIEEQKPVLKKLDTLLRSKLLEVSLPKEISNITISDGTAVLRIDGEFKVILTLGYRGHLSLWRILHLELLVGEKNGPVKLEESRRYALGDDLERRMAAAENPLMILYTVLHEFCVALVMDTVIRQVQLLRQGRWRDAIRFELIADGSTAQGTTANVLQSQDGELESASLKTPGLKIFYWLESDKIAGGGESSSSPFIKIEPGQNLQIKCSHSAFILDPLTDKEAEFSLDQSCIDVEKLLLKVIFCSTHTRLLEIQRELSKNIQLCQAPNDVVLKRKGGDTAIELQKRDYKLHFNDSCGDEVLQVRAYGALYITLGVQIRNGRFLLQSSKGVLTPTVTSEFEDALNQGKVTAAEVFVSLRSRSLLHLFASTGKFLGLKVYDQCLNTVRIPKSVLSGSDMLLMGFPDCGDSYYLLMELEKDFRPLFKLLETQPDSGGNSHSASEFISIIRFHKIDVDGIRTVKDEKNQSLHNWDKRNSLQSRVDSSQFSQPALLSKFGLEPPPETSGSSSSSFSSVVDEVFASEKAAAGSLYLAQNNLTASSDMASFSQFSSRPLLGIKSGLGSPKWEVGTQRTQTNNLANASGAIISSLSGSFHPSVSTKGVHQNSPSNSVSSPSPVRSSSLHKLPTSKSDQELSSFKSPQSGDVDACTTNDEGQSGSTEGPKDAGNTILTSRSRLMSPLRGSGSRASAPGARQSGLKGTATDSLVGLSKNGVSGSSITKFVCQLPESTSCPSADSIGSKNGKATKKRSLSDILMQVPSFERSDSSDTARKKRKLEASGCPAPSLLVPSSIWACKPGGYADGNAISEINNGLPTSNIYISTILRVVRHCSLCIKHARITSQMEDLEIPFVEEVGLRKPSSNLWFRLPLLMDDSWQNICLRLGKPGSMSWDVKIVDEHFRELWQLQKGSTSTQWGSVVRFANASDADSHIHCDSEGVVLSYRTVESSSVQNLVSDLRRLSNARFFAHGMRKLLGVRLDGIDESNSKSIIARGTIEGISEQIRRTFKIEAVGLMSLWFTYGTVPVAVHFVVEWEYGKEGCTIHVSPDQLWPHTKFLEDFVNGGEVASFLDCIRLTAGPLLALSHAIRPARMPAPVGAAPATIMKQNGSVSSQGPVTNASAHVNHPSSSGSLGANIASPLGSHSLHSSAVLSAAARGGPGIVPSSLLPIDVSVVLRGPYWIRIIYRKKFSVDMRCFAGDQVWLQPAPPPKGGPAVGGSLPCPQFRPFIMEHVAQGLNALEPGFAGSGHNISHPNLSINNQGNVTQPMGQNGNRSSMTNSSQLNRANPVAGGQVANNLSRVSNAMLASSGLATGLQGGPLRVPPGAGVQMHVRGELNSAFIGLGDDGGYGGGWVPLAALKKVLRGILKYLGVLWLFAQLPELLKEILGSILKDNEGALLNLDQEQAALRFFVGGYVFAVSVHRVQLLLQVLSVKRFHHQQQQQAQTNIQEELAQSEITEICEYFSRRVASEPYDASRVASFITLLTLPISVLREFLKLIAWKKSLSQAHSGEAAPAQRARVELCLEHHSAFVPDDSSGTSSATRSNIHHDRAHSSVDFALTFVLDPALIPHINAAGGAAWLPYCVSVRLKYSFGENLHFSLIAVEGSHGGRACWSRFDDWEKCKQRVARAVEYANGNSAGDANQGRLRLVAENVQRAFQVSLQQLRDGALSSSSLLT